MKNIFAKVGETIEDNYDEKNNIEYIDSLKSNLMDRMIDSLEEYINGIANGKEGKRNYYIKGDTRIILPVFQEFVDIVYSNGNNIGVRKLTSSLNTDNFRYYFDCRPDELLHYCYYMALKEQEEEKNIEGSKSKTRNRVPFHSNR